MESQVVDTRLGGLDKASLESLRNGSESLAVLLRVVAPSVPGERKVRSFNSSLPPEMEPNQRRIDTVATDLI